MNNDKVDGYGLLMASAVRQNRLGKINDDAMRARIAVINKDAKLNAIGSNEVLNNYWANESKYEKQLESQEKKQ